MTSTLRNHHAAVRNGRMVPLFYLPSTAGGESGPGELRSKYNMVLVFLGAEAGVEGYLRELAASYADVLAAQARVIAVISAPIERACVLKENLSLQFALLADEGGVTTARMLGGEGLTALCVADRFGQVAFMEVASNAARLPRSDVALGWLDYIQLQCPE